MRVIIPVIFACMMTVICTGFAARADVIAPDLQKRLRSIDPDGEVAVIVTLADKVDLKKFKDKDKRLHRNRIIKALKDKSEKTQKHIRQFLERQKAKKIKPFWIFNGLAFTANVQTIEKLAAMKGIENISLDGTLILAEPPSVIKSESLPAAWNIDAIRAPELWNRGYTGTGMVLASMDTGVDYLHPDLAQRWRGGPNSWYDPNGEHATPYDHTGHGTQVMGIMVGGDAGGASIGVAPGARWISVKIFNDAGYSSISIIHEGFQWLMDPDGNPDTNDAPDVINNSWGYPNDAGICLDLPQMQQDIAALKAAQIGVVFSAGNDGPFASTSESPANYTQSFAVGAVDETQTIAFFSSRGPSACDGTVFPELVAPGVNVSTTDLTGDYASVNGTSFAAAHVSGAMGLLLNAEPSLSVEEVESALTASAHDLGVLGPDNDYGYGLLDVMAAFTFLPPIAKNDIVTTPRNQPVTINILANDIATNGTLDAGSVVLRLGSDTVRGATVVNSSGVITYTPEGAGGPDYFYYTVKDAEGRTSNEATVRINRIRAN